MAPGLAAYDRLLQGARNEKGPAFTTPLMRSGAQETTTWESVPQVEGSQEIMPGGEKP